MKPCLTPLFAGALALAAGRLSAAAPVFPVHPLPGGSFVVHAAEVKDETKPTSLRAAYCDQPTATLSQFELHRTILQPGKAPHDPHRHEREEMMILLDGQLDVTIEGAKTRIGPGSAFFVVSNDHHGVFNPGSQPATYLVLNFYTAAGAKIPPGERPAMASTVWEWATVPVKASANSERRDFVSAPTRTLPQFDLHVTTLRPGAPAHGGQHPDEQFFIMKEGEMEATAGGQTLRVGPGDLFFVASGQKFGWRHVGERPSTYYVVRFRTPATPALATTR